MRYSWWHKVSQSCESCWLIQKYCEPVLLCKTKIYTSAVYRCVSCSVTASKQQSPSPTMISCCSHNIPLLWSLFPYTFPRLSWSRWIQMDKDGLPRRQALGSLGLGHRAHELQDALQVFTVPQLREKQLTREDGMLENGWKMLGDVGDGKCYRVNCTASVQIVHSVKLWLFDSVRCESPRWWEVAGLWQLLAASGLAFRWWTSTSLALHHGIATWSAQLSDVCSGDKSCSYLKHVS